MTGGTRGAALPLNPSTVRDASTLPPGFLSGPNRARGVPFPPPSGYVPRGGLGTLGTLGAVPSAAHPQSMRFPRRPIVDIEAETSAHA